MTLQLASAVDSTTSTPAGPRCWPRRGRGPLARAAVAAALIVSCIATPSAAQVIRDDFHVPNGGVTAMALYGNALYIAGGFTRISPSTGCGVPIDKSSALPVSGFPKIAGTVHAVASDGSGGWYVGGDFRAVGGTPRANLAHVLGDNTLASWNPGSDGVVTKLVTGSGVVFAAGSFINVGGAARPWLAALDATSGLATTWDPNPDGPINALALSGATLYVAGDFANIGGQPRAGLAAIDVTTGLATAWDPSPDGYVAALATSASTVYVGGAFTSIGGQPRNRLAAIDATTGNATAWQWQPSSADFVSVLAASGSMVYVGGEFQFIAGGNGFAGLGAFDATTGLPVATWSCGGWATAFAPDGATLFVSGFVDVISGPDRSGVVAIDATTGVPTAWEPQPNGSIYAIAVDGTHVFAGGEFNGFGGVARTGLAALDVTTGEPTSWNPTMTGIVWKMARSGPTLYVGGKFELSVPVPDDTAHIRHNLAAFDLETGAATDWDPNASTGGDALLQQRIAALSASGSTVYVGGRFNEIGGQTRNYLAAIDGVTGAVTDWNPSPNDSVTVITPNGGVVYVGGTFDAIGGQPRGGLAALSATAHDSTDGVTLAWDPKPVPASTADPWPDPGMQRYSHGPIRAIAVSGNTVYMGGRFDVMNGWPGGQWRMSLAAVNATTGVVTPWDAGILVPPPGYSTSYVSTVAADGNAVYASGFFSAGARVNLTALDPVSGTHLDWNPVIGYGSVLAFVIDGPVAYLGGGFISIGNQAQSNVAAVEVPVTTSVGEPVAASFALLGAQPNPTAGDVRLGFSLPDARPARLELLDIAGRRVASREVGPLGAGRHVVSLAPGRPLASGLYWARLTRAGLTVTAKVLVLR